MMPAPAEKWFLVETPKDLCVIERKAIRSSADVEVGDNVAFLWSSTLELKGIVKFISGDHDECVTRAQRLQKESKKARMESFHEDRPRKAAVQASQKISSRVRRSTSAERKKVKKNSREDQEHVTAQGILNRRDFADSDRDEHGEEDDDTASLFSNDGDDCGDKPYKPASDDHSSDSDGSTQLSSPVRRTSTQLSSPVRQTATQLSFSKTPCSQSLQSKKHEFSKSSSSKRGTSTPSTSSSKPLFEVSKIPVSDSISSRTGHAHKSIRVARHRVNAPNKFEGDMFKVDQFDEGAQEVYQSGVYCTENDWLLAENATSATMVARRLLLGIFTDEAIFKCSVSGLPPRGKGKQAYADATIIKPYLCPKAVHAIVCQALLWQKAKHFLKKRDDVQVRQAIQVRLNELQKVKSLPL